MVNQDLMSGTSAQEFSPNESMTRAMLFTVLARNAGVDTASGTTWYQKGLDWVIDNGVSDGSNPHSSIIREQLAVMLYREAGSPPVTNKTLDFSDAQEVSAYAQDALAWAVQNSIVTGANGRLDPKGDATRAQVAAMLSRWLAK